MDALGDEVERGAALHAEGRTHVVREYEHVAVIRGLLAPPALPAVIGPAAAYGPEHVAAEDPGADILDAPRGEVIVGPCLSAGPAEHLLKCARCHEPAMQRFAARSEGTLLRLIGARAVALERKGETVDA